MPPDDHLPPLPESFSRRDLQAAGFIGWQTWDELRAAELADVPCAPGAYVIYRPTVAAPRFVYPSPGGWFKGKYPTVDNARLRQEWVPDTHVVYIGKADLRRQRRKVEALRRRLNEFARFGAGEDIGHWGGRLIWQLADSAELLVAWHEITWPEKARDYEKRLLACFAEHHDDGRPFANLTG